MRQMGASSTSQDDEEAVLLPRQPKFSWRMVMALVIHTAVVNGTSELVWPFLNQLILQVGIAPDQKSVGFYSGCIETVASIFSFATVIPGGFAADRWGRKIVLCATLLGTATSLAFFGTSGSLLALIACRSFGYALGPQLAWSITVTILGDVSDETNRGIAYSAVNASYRIGQFFSPVYSRVFSHPNSRYTWFQSDFWARYPYALPCWAGAITCLGTLYVTILFVPETAPSMTRKTPMDELGEGRHVDYSSPRPNFSKSRPISAAIEDEMAPPAMLPATMEPAIHGASLQPGIELFTPHVVQLLISSWVMYFMTIAFSALFPLWAFTSIEDGGLGASEIVIGSLISARAIAHFSVLLPYAYFETRFGVYRLYAYSMAIFAVAGSLLFPALSVLAKVEGIDSPNFTITILVSFVLGGFGNFCTTCMVIMINQAAPSQEQLAHIVGISQSVLMLGQCMAPIIVLSLFEFSIKSGLFGGNLIWMFLVGVGSIGSLHAFTLKPPVPNRDEIEQ